MVYAKGKLLLKKIASPLFKAQYAGLGQIIVLHRVVQPTKKERLRNTGLEISPHKLEELILFFKRRNYDFISLDQLPAYLEGNKNRFVVFTLDDGYVDNLIEAYPVFKKHAVPFTIYVTTNFPDHKAVLWWYLLEELLLRESHVSYTWNGEAKTINCISYSEKVNAFNAIRHLIKEKTAREQHLLFEQLFTAHSIPLLDKVAELSLSWEQIQQLNIDPLVTIGAHTVSHPSFKAISEEKILNEVEESVRILENKLDTKIQHFAYPYGTPVEVGKNQVEVLKRTSLLTATTGRVGNIMTEHKHHLLALPRIYVGPNTSEKHLNDFINGKTPFLKGAKKKVVTV